MFSILRQFPLQQYLNDSDEMSDDTIDALDSFLKEQPVLEWDINLEWRNKLAFEEFDVQRCEVAMKPYHAATHVLDIVAQHLPNDYHYYRRCMEIYNMVYAAETHWQETELPQQIWRHYNAQCG